MEIRKLSYNCGAEVLGANIAKTLSNAEFEAIHAAFLDYGVLLFRKQPMTRGQHIAFSRRFGELDKHEARPNNKNAPAMAHPDYPEINVNRPDPSNRPAFYAGEAWHSDQCHKVAPAMATLLRSIAIPDAGGDTMFANMYLAYDTLSDGMKKLIEGLHGVHFGGKSRIDDSSPERLRETQKAKAPVAQPIIRVHPKTGRKALYIGEKIKQLVGLRQEESEPILRFLCEHATRPQFVYRHRWQQDDLIMWDNCATIHMAVSDYDKGQVRHMEKTTVKGPVSGFTYDGPLHYEGPRL
jgi:taurine dioxygenase